MISTGILTTLLKNQNDRSTDVILQVLEMKLMGNDTIFALLSDGEHHIEANLDSSFADKIKSGELKELQLVRLNDFTIMNLEKRYVLNINSLTAMQGVPKLGTPKPMNKIMQHLHESYTPISALSTFLYDWTLRAKVIKKSELAEYTNPKTSKTDKYMTILITDVAGAQISGSFFGESAEKFYTLIEIGKVYLFSGGNISLADKKYRTSDSNYKLNFSNSADITLDEDQAFEQRKITREVTPLNKLKEMSSRTMVDVMGVVVDVGLVTEKVSKQKGEILHQRVIKILDDSGARVDLSLWNENASDSRISELRVNDSILYAKSVNITIYNEAFYLSSVRAMTELEFNPLNENAGRIMKWFKNLDKDSVQILDLTQRKENNRDDEPYHTIEQIKNKPPGNEKYFVICRVQFPKQVEKATYPSCIKCNKKVDANEEGVFNCISCGGFSRECTYKYLLRGVMLGDSTGSIFATAFNEAAEFLLKMKAAEFEKKNDEEKLSIVRSSSFLQFVFSIRIAELQRTNQGTRNEFTIGSVYPVNYTEGTKRILNMFEKLKLSK
jgi:replication factor A1